MIKITKEQLAERKVRQEEWKAFRAKHLFTQAALADALGISKRTVQYVEAGKFTPQPDTIAAMRVLQAKHDAERK